MSRAIRRHHRARLKARARKILKKFYSPYNAGWKKGLEHHVNVRWNNMQICSCMSCRNPRHCYDRDDDTMQEKREHDRYLADLDELSQNP